ncbi:hypothetical protein CRUP_005889 [Coryphaenoides rupestris]|nr:hypothetical protein CRUP_005889 [Coryphaenoides rupestris]
MAATPLSLTQLSSGNPVYDKYYRQVDPTGSGRVAAADAALCLKRSGLADLVLGKVWDLADSERKGFLNKQQFFIALRLVACAQNGLEVALKSLHLAVPLPKFHDTNSPLLPGGMTMDTAWVVKAEEKMKFDAIFDSLAPSGGFLTGDKVKPVLLNSKLPVDVLGRVWELSDIDRDGMLDRDEFAVWVVSPADKAMYDELFSKTDGDMDGLVSGPEVRDIFLKTGLPSATLARIWELCDIGDLGKLTREQFALALHLINQKLSKGLEPPQSLSPEMIPPSDRLSIKQKSGVEQEIKEKEESIHHRFSEVQELQDEVSRESLTLQQLHAERQRIQEAVEELDQEKSSLEEQLSHIRQQTSHESQLISSLQSEHEEQEQTICQYEEELVQAREELLKLQEETRLLEEKVQAAREQLTPLQESVRDSYKQVTQDALDDLYSSLASGDLYNSLGFTKAKDSNNIIIMVASPEPESSEEAAEAPEPSSAPPAETPTPARTTGIQTSMQTPPQLGFFQSDPFTDHDPFKDDPFGKANVSDPFGEDPFKGTDPFATDAFFTQPAEDPFTSSGDPFGTGGAEPDPFGTKLNNAAGAPATAPDPFATNITGASTANNLYGAATTGTGSSVDLFGSQGNGEADPFSSSVPSAELTGKDATPSNDPFAPGGTAVSGSGSDPDPFAAVFGNESFGGGFADFSALAKSNGADAFGTNNKNIFQDESPPTNTDVPPALPPKTGTPTRPPPPPPGKRSSISRTESSDSFHRRGHFHAQGSGDFSTSTSTTSSSSSSSLPAKDPMADPFAPSSPPRHVAREPERFASFDKQYPTEEDMIEWAKRESEREEKERLARLTQQEQEDLELAIALSKSELS